MRCKGWGWKTYHNEKWMLCLWLCSWQSFIANIRLQLQAGYKRIQSGSEDRESIKFLPVLVYDGSSMKEVDAQDILDIALTETSATLLAKRWGSALLVNVDNDTLKRLLASPEAMEALMNIKGFRNLNNDLTTIINKSEAVKKAKKENPNPTPKEKRKSLTRKRKWR